MNLGTPCQRQIILVTGAARSGKSEFAEKLAIATGKPVVYIATAFRNPQDPDWEARITQHCLRRPDSWQTLEIPLNLAAGLAKATPDQCLLIDSLGTWVANYLQEDETTWIQTVNDFLSHLKTTSAEIILVAEETGWGIVPAYEVGRLFRDRLGHLIRKIGTIAAKVYLVTGGYALNLTQLGTPLDN